MTKVFNSFYAGLYDGIYKNPDYWPEDIKKNLHIHDNLIHDNLEPLHILDLGCGTGRNIGDFINKGYNVCGVDSSSHMLKQAKKKFKKQYPNQRVTWKCSKIQNFCCDYDRFDAAYMLGDILSYVLNNNDITNIFLNIQASLSYRSYFLFDFWFGPAVLMQKPKQTIKKIKLDNRTIKRIANSKLDLVNNLCTVHYDFTEDSKVIESEEHIMRYFTIPEIEMFLSNAEFKLIKCGSAADIDIPLTENDWHALVLARKL